jgi:hypothetical protein
METVMDSTSYRRRKADRLANPEYLDQVIDAIIDGKYSWACVLLLRMAGFNPLQYIPYRTYNRLLKDNTLLGKPKNNSVQLNSHAEMNLNTKIIDLNYLEPTTPQDSKIAGGNRFLIFW